MPYDPKSHIFRAKLAPVRIPERLSIYDLIFDWDSPTEGLYENDGRQAITRTERKGASWLIDSVTGKVLTYEGTRERTTDIAKALYKAYGLGRDDVVGIYSGNEVDYATTMWAAFRLGAIVSCANPSFSGSELSYQISLVNGHYPVKVLLAHPSSIASAKQAINLSKLSQAILVLICRPGSNNTAEVEACKGVKSLDDLIHESKDVQLPPKITLTKQESRTKLAFLSFSSGTTGLPKAVAIAHYNVISNILQSVCHFSNLADFKPYDSKKKSGDVALGILPMYHIYGLIVVLHCNIFQNIPVVVINKFTFQGFLESIQRLKISLLFMVPPMVVLLVKNPLADKYDLSSVRFALVGAAPLGGETLAVANRKYPRMNLGQAYGMTETATLVTFFDPSQRDRPGASAGIPCPNIELKIVSPEGKLLGPGDIGELWSRSPSNALGYLGNEKATKETFDSDGFVHTGDECYVDEEGNMYVVDRIKELIKVKGNQVAPAELEGFLLEHPEVVDICVIGIPDEYSGERPKAFVVLPPATADKVSQDNQKSEEIKKSIKKHVADHKIAYKHLVDVQFVEVIPKTPSGKLLRKDLRTLHAKTMKEAGKL